MKPRIVAIVSVAFIGLAAPAVSAARAHQPAHHSGVVHVFVLPSGNNGSGPILLTGAIADHGTTVNINKNGTVSNSGNANYALAKLGSGTFRVNLTTLNALGNKTNPTFNATTCSGWQTITGPAQVFGGTGSYRGITGTVTLTETFGFIAPRLSNGNCNASNSAQPVAFMIQVAGTGDVSWG